MATIVPIAPGTGDTASGDGAPDACLVDGLRAGHRDAFEQLYELYRGLIYNLALRILQSPEDARDITQDVFVKVYRRLPGSGLTDLQLKPWLYRVAVNACYDHLRTRKVHRDLDDSVTDTRAVSVDTFEQAEMGHLVEETLGGLSERHRTVLVLKDIHGLRHDEIAGILGISRGATETLLFRARESFRSHYAQLTTEFPAAVCTVARDAAVGAVGGALSGEERRRVMAHAAHCPTCRSTVGSWGTGAVGLGVFIHGVPVPAALQGGFPFAAAGATRRSRCDRRNRRRERGRDRERRRRHRRWSVRRFGAGGIRRRRRGRGRRDRRLLDRAVPGRGWPARQGLGVATVKVAALIVAATCTAGGGVAATSPGCCPAFLTDRAGRRP